MRHLRRILHQAALVTADDMPPVWGPRPRHLTLGCERIGAPVPSPALRPED